MNQETQPPQIITVVEPPKEQGSESLKRVVKKKNQEGSKV